LQFIDPQESTNWSDVLPDFTATGSTTSATDAGVSSTLRFYRVVLVP
jgi:hypothetical protein